MSVTARRRCLPEFDQDSLSSHQDDVISTTGTTPDEPLPSTTMTTPEYLRIHANAPPSKIRDIIKNQIFPRDDVNYLKRLVGDIGKMDYVFRFLWYDGPKPVSWTEWDDTQVKSPLPSSTRGESNRGSSTGVARKVASAGANSNKPPQSPVGCPPKKRTRKSGRTWIQYCCYHNAHQCLQWIFREIVKHHLEKVQQDQEPIQQNNERGLHGSLQREYASRHLSKEGNLLFIIRQLLEYPSHCYCATNYVAVATLRNSHDCLFLLLQHGGLDPSMQINSYGSTPAHLAALNDNVDCLRVLKSGCYDCGFTSSDDDDSLVSENSTVDQSIDSGASGQEEDHRGAFTSMLAVPLGDVKTWAADWNRANALGETPLHVAAREGSCNAMQFFLDLTISFAETEAMCDSSSEDNEDVSMRCQAISENGANIKTNQIGSNNQDNFKHGVCPPVDFSLRNKEGMDCAALAAKNDHGSIIKMLASAIQQIREIEEENSPDIKQSESDDFWQNPLSLLSTIPQERSVTKPLPQSHLTSLRRRANTDPVSVHIEHKALTKLSKSDHGTNQRHPLPRHYPSLNLNNPLEKNNHETPIHVAAREGHLSAMKALFDSGCCDTSARDSLGQTALHIAVLNFRLEICQFFAELNFEQFRKFDVVDILGRTPLYIACSRGNYSIARILTPISNWRIICHERRKSPDGPLYTNVAAQPPLHAAVVNDHVDTVSVLLECGVDVDQLDVDGRTAINAAAKLGYYDMCQMLILHGANVNRRTSRGGPTPYQKAKKYKHSNVADLLYEFGGR